VTDKTSAHARPWRVWKGHFRGDFGGKLIEIHDANGAIMIPWKGFDDDGRMSYTRRLALARQIVKAVNNAQP
jgi:hypothetical protein